MGCCTPEAKGGDGPESERFAKGGERDLSKGPLGNRRCTDIICLVIFLVHWAAFLIVAFVGASDGNPKKLYRPRDFRGGYCGLSSSGLESHGKLVQAMNVTAAVDPIAKTLVCSSSAQEVLLAAWGEGSADYATYLCTCCLMPCGRCEGSLASEDLGAGAQLQAAMGARMSELTDLSQAGRIFSPSSSSAASFDGTELLREATKYFVPVCLSGSCAISNASELAGSRSYTYSPVPESPLKPAWDRLAAGGIGLPAEAQAVQSIIQTQFTFQALPPSRCPYPAQYCVPMPGVAFAELPGDYCAPKLDSSAISAIGQSAAEALAGLGSSSLAESAAGEAGAAFGDLVATLDALAVVAFWGFIIGLVFLVLLRFFVGCAIWASLMLVFLVLFLGGMAAFARSHQCVGQSLFETGASQATAVAIVAEVAVAGGPAASEDLTGNGADYRGRQLPATMPSKVSTLAVLGAGTYGATTVLRAFVAPGQAAPQPDQREHVQHLRRQPRQALQQEQPEQTAEAGTPSGTWALGAAAMAVGVGAAGRRARHCRHTGRKATATLEKPPAFAKMPASVKPGVVTGKALVDLLNYAKENEFAIPGVNIVGTSSINACMEAAKKAGGPIMVTFSRGGGQFIAGKAADNADDAACIAGSVAGAMHVRTVAKLYGVPVILHTDHCQKSWLPWFDGLLKANEEYFEKNGEPLFSSHMLDLSEESLEDNISTCKKYLERMAKVDLLLEMELGITGGEEDGVDNSDVDSSRLYTQPSEVWQVYEALSSVPNGNFTVAAAFGNVHGVYAPGNVELKPVILHNTQAYIKEKLGCESDKPVSFVFHGGSGSSKEDIQYAIKAGVIKMNIDTDTQWAFWDGVNEYQKKNKDYLQGQIGNPEGPEKPNKKYYDPRMALRAGEESMADRLVQAMQDLNCVDRL